MSEISVLVATKSRDLKAVGIAEGIAASVRESSDMNLVEGRCVTVEEVDALLAAVDPATRCALVLVGPVSETNELEQRWLTLRDHLGVMRVDVDERILRLGFHDPRLESLLTALRELVERMGTQKRERVTHIQLRQVKPPPPESSTPPEENSPERPLLEATIKWIHSVLKDAVGKIPKDTGDTHNFSLTREIVLQCLQDLAERFGDDEDCSLPAAAVALDAELDKVGMNTEPLAVAVRAFELEPLNFRLLALTLAPELDICFQRCISVLLDEIGRRVGTVGLYCRLLDIKPEQRGELINGTLAEWLIFEGYPGRPAAADEPLRLDPFLVEWLLEHDAALQNDPRIRRVLRLEPWPGASLLDTQRERATALIEKLLNHVGPRWIVLDGNDPNGWRALLERGAHPDHELIRVEATRLAGVDVIEVEECARRIGRLNRLTRKPLAIDLSKADGSDAEANYLRLFLATLDRMHCRAAVICLDEARTVQLLGTLPFEFTPGLPSDTLAFELKTEPALPTSARVDAVRAAAKGAGVTYMPELDAAGIANRYPLHVDSLEQAMLLAASRPRNYSTGVSDLDRFITALKELAAEGVSHLVDRIEPVFTLDEVVLPPDRKQQLIEIVDNVRLAPAVLDGWKFRDKLPYGRGVAALFSGASGTGKTMAAMGIARRLDIQILRLDLSRVVSKYIGETEKNIDRVFTEAQASGAAILVDEADALLGKRSEVKDAHDRYANIEVAYLLQRMEAYEGLVVLTTNMRKNLDPAFLRRLRFIVDFPRPDAEAREKIWRQCLPTESHEVNDAEFRQLARRLDLTGGQIRQITLRAAFIAAAAGKQINFEHIVQSASAELAKLGMPPIEIDLLQARRAA